MVSIWCPDIHCCLKQEIPKIHIPYLHPCPGFYPSAHSLIRGSNLLASTWSLPVWFFWFLYVSMILTPIYLRALSTNPQVPGINLPLYCFFFCLLFFPCSNCFSWIACMVRNRLICSFMKTPCQCWKVVISEYWPPTGQQWPRYNIAFGSPDQYLGLLHSNIQQALRIREGHWLWVSFQWIKHKLLEGLSRSDSIWGGTVILLQTNQSESDL